ncbi:TetR/AcrR family transcriptional regulator [Rhodococcus phenolicus]|uniref:TetR/AcrR family transcriptional regulator n=1 Tax=Rhodococcus phenolicus TaxID=263849 RepID=UPI000829ADE1|nr:TetR/AcrR family transcriptional regulator [Rhodococcus phenolicus]
MSDKRSTVLDAAIDLLGREGMRGLTHRGVDSAAGLPAGSTSNYFRTRRALLEGVLDRLVDRDRADAAALIGPAPRTTDDLVELFVGYVLTATGPDVVRTRARYALFVEAASVAELRAAVQQRRDELRTWGIGMLTTLGIGTDAGDAEHCARVLMDYLDGVILHRLTSEDEPHPRDGIRRVLDALL